MAIRKILCVVLMISMLFSAVSVFADNDVPEAVMGAVSTLAKYNIITDTKDQPYVLTEYLIRAEMTVLIIKAMGLDEAALSYYNDSARFQDVDPDNPYSRYINFAAELGIVQGTKDMNFEPDSLVTFEQYIKTIVCALGYDYVAKEKGEYPWGHFMVAAEKGILMSSNVKMGDIINRGAAAQILYNAMKVSVMEKQHDINGQATYTTREGKTWFSILNDRQMIGKGTGIVNENWEVSLISQTPTLRRKDEVIIGQTVYKIGETNVFDYIGQTVKFYAQEVENTDWYVLVSVTPVGNDVYTFDAQNIVSMTSDLLTARENEDDIKNVKLRYADNLTVVQNGTMLQDYELEQTVPKYGSVKAIDNNKDGLIDVLFVESVKMFYVSQTQPKRNRIIFGAYKDFETVLEGNRYVDAVSMDYANNMVITQYNLIDNNGNKINFSAIQEDDIIAVYKSREEDPEGNYNKIVLCEKVAGIIEALTNADVTVGGKTYKKSSVSTLDFHSLKVGEQIIFRTDYNGHILDVYEDEYSQYRISPYAYFIRGSAPTISQPAQIQMVWQVFGRSYLDVVELNDRILFNGTRVQSETAIEELSAMGSAPIEVELNSNKHVVRINTQNKASGPETAVYTAATNSFGNFKINYNTNIFFVPDDGDIEKYKYSRYVAFEPGASYNVESYNVDPTSNVAGIVVVRAAFDVDSGVPPIDKTKEPCLISKITHIYDEQLEMASYKVTYLQGTSTYSKELIDSESLRQQVKTLKCGDLVYISLENTYGYIGRIEKVISLTKVDEPTDGYYMVYDDNYLASKNERDIKTTLVLSQDFSGSDAFDLTIYEQIDGSVSISTLVYVYNTKRGTISPGSFDDIMSVKNDGGQASLIYYKERRVTSSEICIDIVVIQ